MSEPAYAELACISSFSFRRGASHPEELVRRAAQLGYQALAITDDGSVAGVVRAHVAAKEVGLSLIFGSSITLDDGLRVVLLAPDREAWGDLCALITRGRRSAPKGSYHLERQDLASASGRLLALWVPRDDPSDDAAGAWVAEQFPGRSWLAATAHRGPDDGARLDRLAGLADRVGLPVVAVGDAEMHARGRRMVHDLLTAIRLGRTIADCGMELAANGERHLRDRATLAELFPPAWLAASVAVAARCQFQLDTLRYEYPEEVVPPGATPLGHLGDLVEQGLEARYPDGAPAAVRERVAHELGLIGQLGIAQYFLTVHEIVAWARARGILCQGRGSAANSAVCYALHITPLDPARHHLLFERFVSLERGEPPDIDVDFEHSRREEVIQHLYAKYGRDRAALTATVIRWRPKSAVRDVGRALGIDEGQLDRLAKGLSWWDRGEDMPRRLQDAGFDPDSPLVRRLIELSRALIDLPRHLSQHVGGFVLSQGPLCRLVPIENAAMADRTVIEWDKDDLDAVGLMKVDVLALGMLTALRKAMTLVSALRGQTLHDLAQIPPEDPATYQMIQRADTIGVFQIESRAQMSMLPRMKPACLYDLVIEVAIVRPGPIQGGMVHPYLRRRQGLEPVDYPSEAVKGVLERTLGVPIFQEQVMQLAVVAAGFTPGEADQLRRSMASWRRTGALHAFRARLCDGMVARGYALEFAERVFRQIEGFSEYGFPESHAASFAILTYASCWLKCHEPAAFTAALLNSQPMGFYGASQLVADLRGHGVEVRPVCVQRSGWDCALEADGMAPGGQPALRLGLRLVKGLGEAAGQAIESARAAGPFAGVDELAARTGLGARALGALARADALAALAGHRRRALWEAAGADAHGAVLRQPSGPTPDLPPPTPLDEVIADYRATSLSLLGHPVGFLRRELVRRGMCSARELSARVTGDRVRVCGLVTVRQRPETASGVVFVTLEDETGAVNVIVWRRVADRDRRALVGSRLLQVDGQLQHEAGVCHLIADGLTDRSAWLGELGVRSRDFH